MFGKVGSWSLWSFLRHRLITNNQIQRLINLKNVFWRIKNPFWRSLVPNMLSSSWKWINQFVSCQVNKLRSLCTPSLIPLQTLSKQQLISLVSVKWYIEGVWPMKCTCFTEKWLCLISWWSKYFPLCTLHWESWARRTLDQRNKWKETYNNMRFLSHIRSNFKVVL